MKAKCQIAPHAKVAKDAKEQAQARFLDKNQNGRPDIFEMNLKEP